MDSSTRRVLNERRKKERRGDSEQRKAKMSTGLPSLGASVPTVPTVFLLGAVPAEPCSLFEAPAQRPSLKARLAE